MLFFFSGKIHPSTIVVFFRPFDSVLVILICGLTIASFFLLKGTSGSRAEIYLESHKIASFELNGSERFKEIDSRIGTIQIRVGEGTIQVLESPCSQKICILQGAIRETHEHIICLPARMVISIINQKSGETSTDAVDAFSY